MTRNKTLKQHIEAYDNAILSYAKGDLDVVGDLVMIYGPPATGKTCLEAILSTAHAGAQWGWVLEPREMAIRQLVRYKSYLDQGRTVPPDDRGEVVITAYRAVNTITGRVTNLVFPSAAGGYCGQLEALYNSQNDQDRAVARCLNFFLVNATAVLVLVDVGDDEAATNVSYEAVALDLDFARRSLGLEPGVPRCAPLAVVLTKMDRYFTNVDNRVILRSRGDDEPVDYLTLDEETFQKVLRKGTRVLANGGAQARPPAESGFSPEELAFFNSAFSAKDFLEARQAHELMRTFERSHSKVGYFGTSNVGIFPYQGNYYPRLFRVKNGADTRLACAPLFDLRPISVMGPICWALDWGSWLSRSSLQILIDRIKGRRPPAEAEDYTDSLRQMAVGE